MNHSRTTYSATCRISQGKLKFAELNGNDPLCNPTDQIEVIICLSNKTYFIWNQKGLMIPKRLVSIGF